MTLLAASDYYTLLEIFIFLAVAQVTHSITKRAGFPEIVADLLVGMVIGSYALGGVIDRSFSTHLFEINPGVLLFADLSVVLLLFSAGLGGGFTSLRKAGAPAVLAAIAGDLVPFTLSFLIFSRIYPVDSALFMAVAAAATSAAVAASLIRDEKLGHAAGAQFLINVAALDDVVALVLLSVVIATVQGSTDPFQLTSTVFGSVISWLVLLLAAVVLLPRLVRRPLLKEAPDFPFALLFVLIAIVLALGFSPIIGAYIAGLAIAESVVASRTRDMTSALVLVFGPLFFIVVGAAFDVGLLLDPVLIAAAVILSVLATLGKVVGVYPFARWKLRSMRQAQAVAVGMIPRGEIGLIVGAIGLTSGLLTQQMLGEIVVMSIGTTLVGSLLFRRFSVAFRLSQRPLQ